MRALVLAIGIALIGICLQLPAIAQQTRPMNSKYPMNRAPLQPSAFIPLPLASIRPTGWLKDQLTIQANGLTGHLDEFWPDLGPNTAWKGGGGEGWERGPYYLDGLVPLAYILNDQRLIEKTKPWIEWMLQSSHPNGWFGPTKNKDRWPLAVALKVLTQYYEATGDERALNVIKRYFDYLKTAPPDWPARDWRGVRAGENVLTAFWLYNRTGNPDYIAVAQSIFANCFDWSTEFVTFPNRQPGRKGHPTHTVNIAMALKYPALQYALTGDEKFKKAAYEALDNLDKYHGQVAGRYAADEHLAGRHPSQGTELCAIVEGMFSLSHLTAILGDGAFADRAEMLAYNALPGTCTPDFWAHQYDQQANQVICSRAKRNWVSNGDDSNLYGLEPNFGCCTANMHQGWPKLVSHMWMATPDNGLAAIVYGPDIVNAKVAGGIPVTITQTTDYPFDGTIHFSIATQQPVEFPLYLRVPGWAAGDVAIKMGTQTISGQATGTFLTLKRNWKNGDTLDLILPMKLRAETRYNNAIAIYRGPLVFSLKIGERYEKVRSHGQHLPAADWAIYPQTPWNYGLLVDSARPESSITVSARKVGPTPFANDTAPVTLMVKGKLLPNWGIVNNSADAPPPSPVESAEPLVDLQLIPYGCTRLRVTEFPTLKQ